MWDELRDTVPADDIVGTQTKCVTGCEQNAASFTTQ